MGVAARPSRVALMSPSSFRSFGSAVDAKEQARFILYASQGCVSEMTDFLQTHPNVLSGGDYDSRTALHLAAAEGQIEAIQFLLAQGAALNVLDRGGFTPLDSAVEGGHDQAVLYLREHGAVLSGSRAGEMVALMLAAAGADNTAQLQRLLHAGVSASCADYDLRTPLHLAASEGSLQAAQLLIENGADVNAVDRFGNSPLTDCQRGVGEQFKALEALVKAHGGVMHTAKGFNSVAFSSAMTDCMPFLVQRGAFDFCEAWLPSLDNKEFSLMEYWYANPAKLDQLRKFGESKSSRVRSNNPNEILGQVYAAQKAVVVNDLQPADMPNREQLTASVGLKSSVVVPIVYQGRCFGLFAFYNTDGPIKHSPEFLDAFTLFVSRVLTTGVYGSELGPVDKQSLFEHLPYPKQAAAVYGRVCKGGVFSPSLVYHEVEWYYAMGLQSYYFEHFSVRVLANHIHAYIAAKKFAQTVGSPENIWLHIENNPAFAPSGRGPEQALMMIPDEDRKILAAERKLEALMNRIPADKACSLEYFLSTRSHVPYGSKKIGLYVLKTTAFPDGAASPTEHRLDKVASPEFISNKTAEILGRYQTMLDLSAARSGPQVKVFDQHYRDGSTPLMISFKTNTANYLVQLTQLLQQNGLLVLRKFVETFANGTTTVSLFLQKPDRKAMDTFLDQFKLCHILPSSDLTPHFLSGVMGSDQYNYSSAVGRFVYYFINSRTDDYDALLKSLDNDPINQGRLKLLYTRMKRESVSLNRITEVVLSYPDIMADLQTDFKARTMPGYEGLTVEREGLAARIAKTSTGLPDRRILEAILLFNSCVLKTNFYKSDKEAISFRLEPTFVAESGDWPATPFAVFFILGADFQGFHLRFRDVARGGIRLVQSRDINQYNSNMQTLFAETYGLAYTQNNKNKDIPEFGSKGTILLSPEATSEAAKFNAFKKYTSALLDLLVPHPEVLNPTANEELLFLGPDEGTANMMEWAAVYARKRDLAYWRAFTTGKPPSLGGIPHDTYGMTTRSVHRYVLGCLRKLGMEEATTTKIQTGGPDGDLGSNEILISNDKTIAIVDGAGVVYDPAGLDRPEMTRLAVARVTCDEFEVSKLGEGGFRVLVGDKDVTLPDGSVVESGIQFRNDFHLSPLATADMFVPCGGRPESVNLSNVQQMFKDDGTPKFKIIVEGANLFFTNDARMVLDKAGVVLFKDASTNKGGVTSSSKEVLAALALDEATFAEHMAVADPERPPEFYQAYCQEIQDTVENLADLEFECLWRERERTGACVYQLTETVSEKINELNDFVRDSDTLWDNVPLRKAVMRKAYPQTLQQLAGLDHMLETIPESYSRAIFGCFLASQYVYKHGLEANEFSFFEFMQPFFEEADDQ